MVPGLRPFAGDEWDFRQTPKRVTSLATIGYLCMRTVCADMGKTRWQTRLDPDDTERVEEYRDDRDLSDAEAVRRLLREGLDAVEEPDEAVADGGWKEQTTDRLDRLESSHKTTTAMEVVQSVSIAVGLLYIILNVAGVLSGALAIVVGVVLLIPLLGVSAYSLGVVGWSP